MPYIISTGFLMLLVPYHCCTTSRRHLPKRRLCSVAPAIRVESSTLRPYLFVYFLLHTHFFTCFFIFMLTSYLLTSAPAPGTSTGHQHRAPAPSTAPAACR